MKDSIKKKLIGINKVEVAGNLPRLSEIALSVLDQLPALPGEKGKMMAPPRDYIRVTEIKVT